MIKKAFQSTLSYRERQLSLFQSLKMVYFNPLSHIERDVSHVTMGYMIDLFQSTLSYRERLQWIDIALLFQYFNPLSHIERDGDAYE